VCVIQIKSSEFFFFFLFFFFGIGEHMKKTLERRFFLLFAFL